MDELEIITTSDGSHTLRNKQLNETYHSVHGALRESMHVFIAKGLEYYHAKTQSKYISIFEVGFGTGLNAMLAFRYSIQHNLGIHYTTLEPFPLIENIWSKLNYAGEEGEQFESIHRAPWDREVMLTPLFTLEKRMVSLQDVGLSDRKFDVIFFDAFAPSVQPEMWHVDALKKVAGTLSEGGVFVTYSARGQVKRDLKSLGLVVETLEGPPGKKEMVRGVR